MENDDHRAGWVGFQELNRESKDHEIDVIFRDSVVCRGTAFNANLEYTEWRDLATGSLVRRRNDSISAVSWKSGGRGIEDGVLLSVPVLFLSTMGLASRSLGGAIVAYYVLPVYPVVGGVVGALVKHKYYYRYLPQQTLPSSRGN